MKLAQIITVAILLLSLVASFQQIGIYAAEEDSTNAETTTEDDTKKDEGDDDILDLSGDDMTVKQPSFDEPVPEGWEPIKDVGADLACSACETIVDRLQGQMRTAERAAKEQVKKERKLAEKEGDGEKKEEGEDADAEKKEEGEDADAEKKGDDKEDVKIDKKEVAAFVVNQACNHTNFIGMSKIGSYPGRKYTFANYDTAGLKPTHRRDVTNICKHILSDDDTKAYVVKALAGSGKTKVKRMKRNLCERRAKVCKSAALGYEAESACVMKSMRAFDKGDYEKAKQYAADCGATTV